MQMKAVQLSICNLLLHKRRVLLTQSQTLPPAPEMKISGAGEKGLDRLLLTLILSAAVVERGQVTIAVPVCHCEINFLPCLHGQLSRSS